MSFNILKKAPYGPGPKGQKGAAGKGKKELSAPVIRFPFSQPTVNSRDREKKAEWGYDRPRSPVMRLSTPNTLTGKLVARLPMHVQLFIRANVGLLLVASSQIFLVGMGLSAKHFVSTTEISTLTLIMVRMLITAACCIGWLAAEGKEEHVYLGPPEIRRLLVWRGLTGFASLYSSMQSFRGLSVSDSTAIQFLVPNLTSALGFVMLGETLGWRDVVAGLTCLGGVMLISRPAFVFGQPAEGAQLQGDITHAERTSAVVWALVSVACSALSYISIRRIGKRAHAMHSMLYFCYGSIVPCFFGLVFHLRSFVFIHSWREFNLIMIIGFFGFAGQILLTSGIQREKVGRATLATYLALLYSLILELYLFRTVPPFLSILGAGIIVASAVWVIMHRENDVEVDGKPGSPKSKAKAKTAAKVYDEERGVPGAVSRSVSPVNGGYGSEYKAKRGELYQSYGRGGTPPMSPYLQPQSQGYQ